MQDPYRAWPVERCALIGKRIKGGLGMQQFGSGHQHRRRCEQDQQSGYGNGEAEALHSLSSRPAGKRSACGSKKMAGERSALNLNDFAVVLGSGPRRRPQP
jgi:hypothetical protein